MPKGKPLTPAEIAYFTEGYQQGVSVKIMADHIGVHYHTLNNLRSRLGIKQRRGANGHTAALGLYLTQELHAAVKRRAREKGASVNQYIVGLIRRDVGFNLAPIREKAPTLIPNTSIKSELEERFNHGIPPK